MLEHLRLPSSPLAHPANVVVGDSYRISVLDAGLLRLEYTTTGQFEDRASQTVVNRAFPPTDFHVVEDERQLEIHTDRLHLVYDKGPFSPEGLSVRVNRANSPFDSVWRYGQAVENLGGTVQTLDGADGPCELENGVLSKQGIAVLNDSRTVLLTADGWLAPRGPGSIDVYVFAYGRDYKQALRAFYTLTGKQPLLPRFALGNWWSRYHPYSAAEYIALFDRFAQDGLPFSVAVVDMDWHITDVDPKYGNGWTGYTWNRRLFPDPPAFLESLHSRDLKVSLNVHPADGIRAFEDCYEPMAKAMGIDPASELPVNFDPTDPQFVEAYLERVNHPLEDDGVDFWWLDWQSGPFSRMAGLDPLWVLNHVHYLDSGRHGGRSLTFSRYAGAGSHRYPIGFSGDTIITWASLDFQPYFTATASNAGYGWWSHDIGGHWQGVKDDELATRWVQFGVFAPIMRLHSGSGPFHGKEPWRFDDNAAHAMKAFLRLRHQLLPYLHTMNHRAHAEDEPLVQPMYYEHPWEDAAYQVPNQYMFGTDLMVAPITTPMDPQLKLGRVRAWLPEGTWIDVFTGMVYQGGRVLYLYRGLESIPVLARAGTITPLVPEGSVSNSTANPTEIELRVFAGADGGFTLREDREDEKWASTRFQFTADSAELVIHPVEGHRECLPQERTYQVVLVDFASVESVSVVVDGSVRDAELDPGPVPGSVRAHVGPVGRESPVHVRVHGSAQLASNDVEGRLFSLLDRARLPFALKEDILRLASNSAPLQDPALALQSLDLSPHVLGAVCELLYAR
jgi:alpha-glucosidase (family GH31 glycosyl hydrolase)